MRLIDADAMRDNWLENGENEYVYDTNAFLDSIDEQPTVDAVTIEELEQLRDEMAKCEGGDSYLIYYGHRFSTDMGYAFDGIDMLIDCLKIKRERKGGVDE